MSIHKYKIKLIIPFPSPIPLFPLPLSWFPSPIPLLPVPCSLSLFLSVDSPCSLSLSVDFPLGFSHSPSHVPSPSRFLSCPCSLSVSPCSLSVSLAICAQRSKYSRQRSRTKIKDSRGNMAPPSQFSSLSPLATVKIRERASTRDMVAGSGDAFCGGRLINIVWGFTNAFLCALDLVCLVRIKLPNVSDEEENCQGKIVFFMACLMNFSCVMEMLWKTYDR